MCSGLDEELAEGTASSDRVCGVDKKKFRYVEDEDDLWWQCFVYNKKCDN